MIQNALTHYLPPTSFTTKFGDCIFHAVATISCYLLGTHIKDHLTYDRRRPTRKRSVDLLTINDTFISKHTLCLNEILSEQGIIHLQFVYWRYNYYRITEMTDANTLACADI